MYNDKVDGIFGKNTEVAVKNFQTRYNLNVNGIVDPNFWNKLLPFISVPTDVEYSYDLLIIVVSALVLKFNFLIYGFIGLSAMEKEIPYVRIGKGKNTVLYVASTHANEWITTPVLLKFIEDFCTSYVNNSNIIDIPARDIFNSSSIYIVPMLNPDGVDLVTSNMDNSSSYYLEAKTISANYPGIAFPTGWKANIEGIDLNLQFPAGWENAKVIKGEQGYVSPAPRDFVGIYPLQAPEAISIYDFANNINPNLMLTYHSQGNTIYWKYLDYNPPRSEEIGKKFAEVSGYFLEETPYSSSFAGFKDWFILAFNRPGYTIEVGSGISPLPLSQFDDIYKRNIGILTLGAVL